MAPTVLVTGATSFIAAHVIHELVKKGYHVRGTVRRTEQIAELHSKYPQFQGKVDYVVVEDITKLDAFNDAVKGVIGAFHLASPVTFEFKHSAKKEIIDPAVNGTISLLHGASTSDTIKRVVITSSIASVTDYSKPAGFTFSEKDWNSVTLEQAESNGLAAYSASKTFAEKAVWEFVETKKPKFDVVALLPSLNFGPTIATTTSPSDLTGSAGLPLPYLLGKATPTFSHALQFVDVRDVALIEVAAFESPAAGNQRYLISAGNFQWQDFINYYHAAYPGRLTASKPGPLLPGEYWNTDTSKATRDLGIAYRSKEETFQAWAASLDKLQLV